MQLGPSTGVAADLQTGWNLDPLCPLFLTLQNHDDGSSILLESRERKVITTRSHVTFAVRECFEQMHRGDHFIFDHPLNASTRNESCIQKLIAHPSVFRIEGLPSGKSGFVREPTSWWTNFPDLAEALEKWRESVSGVELDRHAQVKNGSASARYLVELVESFLKIIREDLRGNRELSDAAAFSAGPSPVEDCLAEDTFVDDARGRVLETERVKQARREELQWCRGMGVGEPILRKNKEAEGARAVSLRWIDTDRGDVGREN